ncbi:MAG: hypothetical protein LKJ80_02305 [Oscillibacter sp.]|jgi:cytochrome b561|nr:hypothetical protein [Oscillibacter sp.]
MMDHSILGLLSWIAPNLIPVAFFFVISKFLTKRIPCKPLDRFFMKVHIPLGWILLVCTVYHTAAALTAGQTMSMQGGDTYTIPTVVFVSGLIATAAIIVAAVAFYLRKKLKGKWLQWHRAAAIIAAAATAWHMIAWFSQKG